MRGPSNYMSLLVNRASMTGFLVFDFAARYGEAAQEMAGWMKEGRLKSFEDVATGGVEQFPETLLRLFRGENLGKLVLEVSPGLTARATRRCGPFTGRLWEIFPMPLETSPTAFGAGGARPPCHDAPQPGGV